MAKSRGGPAVETEAAWQAHYIKWAETFGIQDPCGYYPGYQRIVAIYTKYVQKESTIITSRLSDPQQYEDMPRRSTPFSNFVVSLRQPIYLIWAIWHQSSSTTCCLRRTLLANVLLLTTKSLLSCDVPPLLVRIVIWLITFSLTLYLSVVTLVPVWANMHRLLKTKSNTIHIHLVWRSSKLSLPAISYLWW